MHPGPQWMEALDGICAFMIVGAGLSFVLGKRRLGRLLLLLAVGTVTVSVLVPGGLDWRAWLPDYIDDAVVIYVLCIVGFLVGINLLRHVLALFIGYGAANSAVGNILSSVILAVFTILVRPLRALRRMGGGGRRSSDDF